MTISQSIYILSTKIRVGKGKSKDKFRVTKINDKGYSTVQTLSILLFLSKSKLTKTCIVHLHFCSNLNPQTSIDGSIPDDIYKKLQLRLLSWHMKEKTKRYENYGCRKIIALKFYCRSHNNLQACSRKIRQARKMVETWIYSSCDGVQTCCGFQRMFSIEAAGSKLAFNSRCTRSPLPVAIDIQMRLRAAAARS